MLGTRTLLGLAIDEFGLVVAEVAARVGRPEVRRVGQLTFEEKLSAETAKDLGQQLRQFLRANHFSSRHAIVGIPTKWIVAKEIVAPPASAIPAAHRTKPNRLPAVMVSPPGIHTNCRLV